MGLKMTQEQAKFQPRLRKFLRECSWTPPLKRTEDQAKRWKEWGQNARLGKIFLG